MAKLHGSLCRQALTHALKGVSTSLLPEHGADSNGERVALFCVPDPGRLEAIVPLGLVRKFVAQGPAAFEFFQEGPSVEDLLTSLCKGLSLRQPRRWPARPDEPWLWLICGARPRRTFSALAFEPERGWPRGVYAGPAGLRTRIVVTNELPRTVETLLLRLLGSGAPWRGALSELGELGSSHPVGALMIPLIVRLHLEWRDRAEPGDREVERYLADTRALSDAFAELTSDVEFTADG
jgi:hypothetical protein